MLSLVIERLLLAFILMQEFELVVLIEVVKASIKVVIDVEFGTYTIVVMLVIEDFERVFRMTYFK